VHALVTGIAGFIGSHLAERLVHDGWDVRGIDSLTPYYDVAVKRQNLRAVAAAGVHDITVGDMLDKPLEQLLSDVDVVFHLAAQPGVRASWSDFETYTSNNVVATQRVLEAARQSGAPRVVLASSSSVYGQITSTVTEESDTRPFSPYGVTKLAAEALCRAYAANFALPTVSLRLFTVYGPRQRPDMAFQRMITAALRGEEFPLYGDGSQRRSFTYVGDVVDAAVRAAVADVEPGTVLNIAGSEVTSLLETMAEVERLTGRPLGLERFTEQAGDVARTDADATRAGAVLGWAAGTNLAEGLARQVEHCRRQTAQMDAAGLVTTVSSLP
jgi:UDP-glucuronate 4-epimerase